MKKIKIEFSRCVLDNMKEDGNNKSNINYVGIRLIEISGFQERFTGKIRLVAGDVVVTKNNPDNILYLSINTKTPITKVVPFPDGYISFDDVVNYYTNLIMNELFNSSETLSFGQLVKYDNESYMFITKIPNGSKSILGKPSAIRKDCLDFDFPAKIVQTQDINVCDMEQVQINNDSIRIVLLEQKG
jgi:hypothetical protein